VVIGRVETGSAVERSFTVAARFHSPDLRGGRFVALFAEVSRSSQRWLKSCRPAAAVMMLGLWLATLVLAAAPQLHTLLHQDSNQSGHECVVTLLSKSQLLSSSLTLGVELVKPAFDLCVRPPALLLPSGPDYRLTPSRAPPGQPPHDQIAG
jgi:hypothetical protein